MPNSLNRVISADIWTTDKSKELIELYHCTSSYHAKEVCEKGLLISRSVSFKGKIFLSKRPEHIFGCVCFKVTIPKEWVQLNYGNWEYTCDRDIPSEFIKFHSYEEDE